jgi:hypothetical protein
VEDGEFRHHDVSAIARDGYEWFYFDADVIEGDGIDKLVVLFSSPDTLNPRYLTRPRERSGMHGIGITAILSDGRFLRLGDYILGTRSFREEEDDSSYTLTLDSDGDVPGNTGHFTRTVGASGLPVYSLEFDLIDELAPQGERLRATGELVFEAVLPEWRCNDGYNFKGKKDYHRWVVHVPRAEARGYVELSSLDGGAPTRLTIARADGYHDHNWGNTSIVKLTRRWHWGRAYSDDHTLIFAQVTPFLPKWLPFGPRGFDAVYLARNDGGSWKIRVDDTWDTRIEPSDVRKTSNRLKVPMCFGCHSTATDGPSPVTIDIANGAVVSDVFSYYASHAAEVEITVPGSGENEVLRAEGLVEFMHLPKMLWSHLVKTFVEPVAKKIRRLFGA